MTSIGPYTSKWTSRSYFIVSAPITDKIIAYSVVADGEQANEGIIHLTKRDAIQYMEDNGFTLSPKQSLLGGNSHVRHTT